MESKTDSYTSLHRILKNNYVYDLFYTHVSLVHPRGKYSLSCRSTLEDFWSEYCSLVEGLKKDEPRSIGIAEVPQKYSPVLVDIDMKFKMDDKQDIRNHLYSPQFVKLVVSLYQKVLSNCVEGITDQQLLCVYLDKPLYSTNDTEWKNGFHLHFPNLFLERMEQEVLIIPKVLKEFSQLDEKHAELIPDCLNPENIIDRKAIGNTWLLYGSVKSEGSYAYSVAKVYGYNQGTTTELNLDALISCRIYGADEEPIHLTPQNVVYHYPRIFSIIPFGRPISAVKESIQHSLFDIHEFIPKPKVQKSERTSEQVLKDIKIAKKLMGLLSPQRAVSHDDWMQIGWTLYNISNGSEEGLDMWVDFSLQTSDHSQVRCIYEWNKMNNRGTKTLGSLKFYVKADSPEGYKRLMAEEYTNQSGQLNTSHHYLASLLYDFCGEEFVYCNKNWYQFTKHYWILVEEGLTLRKKITELLIPMFKTMREQKRAQSEKDSDEVKELLKLLNYLENNGFKTAILSECRELFHDQKFEDKLDTNRYTIGFENGIYDLKLNIFRDGLPSDYISNHMPIQYKEYAHDSPEVQELHKIFAQIFTNPKMKRYFLDVMSETFVGYNHRKEVYMWLGFGDNAKSVTQNFFEAMYGRLSIKAPTTLFTSKKQGVGSATAELARAGGGVRLMFLDEPDAEEEVYTGLYKQLSGNDSFFARDLYQTGKQVKESVPMFKMIFICNTLPRVRHGGDKAFWKRTRVIPFESTFVSTAPTNPELQWQKRTFPVDITLPERIPQLVEALAWMLLQHRLEPRGETPEEVIAATKKYQSQSDIINLFTEEFLIKTGSEQDIITLQDVYQVYKDFCRAGSMDILNMMLLGDILEREIGKPFARNKWWGYQIRVEVPDIVNKIKIREEDRQKEVVKSFQPPEEPHIEPEERANFHQEDSMYDDEKF